MDSRKENENIKSKREAAVYWASRVRLDGESAWILLTDKEILRAKRRAENNPEDLPSLWERIRLVFGI
jgi:hypothetical protein